MLVVVVYDEESDAHKSGNHTARYLEPYVEIPVSAAEQSSPDQESGDEMKPTLAAIFHGKFLGRVQYVAIRIHCARNLVGH